MYQPWKAYDDSPDNKLFDNNALNKIERRTEKFIKNNQSKSDDNKFKYKKVKPKKEIKPYDFTKTGSFSGAESDILNKVHSIKSSSSGSKLNFLKPGK